MVPQAMHMHDAGQRCSRRKDWVNKQSVHSIILFEMSKENDAVNQIMDELEEEEPHEEQSTIDHDDLVKLTKEAIKNFIESDPLLSDLPADPTLEEVRAQIAVVQGQSIVLYLERGALPKLSIVVPTRGTTVLDLKKAVKRHTHLALKRANIKKKISWKHVWRKNYLSFEGLLLINDHEDIQDYGICSKSVLKYVKRKREKNKVH